jgi:glutathione S-transferase
MSSELARACANAKKELDRIESELREIAEFYFLVGSALEHSPPRLVIANSDLGERPDIGPRWMVPTVDYLVWPNRERVKEKLRDYYRAEEAYAEAWRALPSDARSQFPRPKR